MSAGLGVGGWVSSTKTVRIDHLLVGRPPARYRRRRHAHHLLRRLDTPPHRVKQVSTGLINTRQERVNETRSRITRVRGARSNGFKGYSYYNSVKKIVCLFETVRELTKGSEVGEHVGNDRHCG